MNRNLFLAILAMDSYNRGYEPGIRGLSDDLGSAIGDASVIAGSNGASARSAGFYGIAYNWNGETVISYRGTNFNFLMPIVQDVLDGWFVGTGISAARQAGEAADFFNAVINGADPLTANVTLTGHSLGGGLAGLVGALYHQKALVFDHMSFEGAALDVWTSAEAGLFGYGDRYYGGQEPWMPSTAKVDAIATQGEVLEVLLRSVVASETPRSIDSHSNRSMVDLHSMSLLVSLMWAEDNASTDWHSAGAHLWNAFFHAPIAAAIPKAQERAGPLGTPIGVMEQAIAYSAIDSGERPFGDVALHAMFNDATDLGRVLSMANASRTVKDGAGAMGEILVQFAGKLALGDVEGGVASEHAKGVLELSQDRQLLTIDFSDSVWAAGAAHTKLVGRLKLIAEALAPSSHGDG
jgi:hypothetical protein